MKTIYFVRHGQSEANAVRITAGGGLDVDLTKHGIDQAVKTGKILKGKGVQQIVSSPLKRAYNTAVIIAKEIGIKPSAIVINDLFTERYLGDMTGKPHDKVQLYFDMGIAPPGGESSEEMQTRVAKGMVWLKTLEADKIVLVSHGGPGRALRSILRNEPHHSVNSLATVGNAEILELTF